MRIFTVLVALTALTATPAYAETYRLIHAIGNDERELARELEKAECERLKADRIALAEKLGAHSERLGVGSVTCLPESLFDD